MAVAGRVQSAFTVAHHLCGVKIMDTKSLGGRLYNIADETVGSVIDDGDTSVGDVDISISNVCRVELSSRGLV